MSEQESIRCVIMRGGTSKGLYFRELDLPPRGPTRDWLLLRLMGSPGVLQIDGLGASRPITSKVAIVAPSSRPDADVDYTFAQVGIYTHQGGYSGNCGNISSGAGPFRDRRGHGRRAGRRGRRPDMEHRHRESADRLGCR